MTKNVFFLFGSPYDGTIHAFTTANVPAQAEYDTYGTNNLIGCSDGTLLRYSSVERGGFIALLRRGSSYTGITRPGDIIPYVVAGVPGEFVVTDSECACFDTVLSWVVVGDVLVEFTE